MRRDATRRDATRRHNVYGDAGLGERERDCRGLYGKVDGNSSLWETATIVLSFTVAVRCEMSAAEMRTCNSVSRNANRRSLVSERYTGAGRRAGPVPSR